MAASVEMILIADSGATKTDWCFGDASILFRKIHTEGINPFHQTEEKISEILETNCFLPLEMGRKRCFRRFIFMEPVVLLKNRP